MSEQEERRVRRASSIAIALAAVSLSFVLRETTDLAFGWRLLIALPVAVAVGFVAEELVKRRA